MKKKMVGISFTGWNNSNEPTAVQDVSIKEKVQVQVELCKKTNNERERERSEPKGNPNILQVSRATIL